MKLPERKSDLLLIAAVLLIGATLRIWGIDFGMPIKSSLYIRPDESLLVQPALHFFEWRGDPHSYVYPALVIGMTAVVFELRFPLARLAGWTAADQPIQDFAALPSAYFMVPRWISAGASILTILLVYCLAHRLSRDRKVALLASLLYATAPLAVRDAHFGVTDNVMVLFLTSSLLAGMAAIDLRRGFARSGFLFGLAAASKYTALLLGPRLILAVTMGAKGSSLRSWLTALAAVTLLPAGIFFIFNPYVIPNLSQTIDELLNILRIFYLYQPGDPPWTVAEAILQILRPLRFGPGELAGLGLAGVGIAGLLRPEGAWRSPAMLPIGYCALHLLALFPFRHLVPYRYLLPVLPLLAVFAAIGAKHLLLWSHRRILKAAVAAVILLALGCGTSRSVSIDRLLSRTDTRTLAGDWIEKHVDPSIPVVILCPPEAEPQVYENEASIHRRTQYVRKRYGAAAGEFISRLYLDQLADPRRTGHGWQLHRFPEPSALDQPVIVLVSCSHPLRMGRTPPQERGRWKGQVTTLQDFASCSPELLEAAWDWIDALFLPFNRLGEVERPGPNLRIEVLDRSSLLVRDAHP